MDLAKVLAQLRNELEYLNVAIENLERLQQTGRRRGRPPSGLPPVKKKRGRPPSSGKTAGPAGDKHK